MSRPRYIAPRIAARKAMSPGRAKALVVFLYILAAALFNIIYANYSGYRWGYMGLRSDLEIWRLTAGLSGLGLLVLMLPTRSTPRVFFLHCFALLYVMPSASLFGYNDFPALGLICVFTASFIVYFVSGVPFPLDVRRSLGLKPFSFGIIGATGLLIVAIVFFGGLRTFSLDLNQVYALRDEAADNLPAVFDYILPAFTKTLIPFGIAAALYYRYRNFAILLVVASVILFGITTHKIVLFAPVVVTLTYIAIARLSPVLVLTGATTFILASIAIAINVIEYIPSTSFWGWLESMFMWRSFIVPSYLDYEYIRFFSNNPQYYWSNSQITMGLLAPPHNGMSIPQLIGTAVFQMPAMQANTGFIGSGFAQAGFIGVVLYSIGVGIILSLTEAAGKVLGAPFVISASLTLILTIFMSTDFVSMFLTQGLLLASLLLLLLKPAGPGPNAMTRGG